MRSAKNIKGILLIIAYFVFISMCVIAADRIYARYERLPFQYTSVKLVLQKWRPIAYKISDIPGLVYEMLPNLNKKDKDGFLLETNSMGIRAREYKIPKPDGTFRILILGDSVSYGLDLTKDKVFSVLLEKMLNDKKEDIQYEVINASVPGYNTMEEYISFVNKYYKYKPDLVIVGFCFNDLSPAFIQWSDHNSVIYKDIKHRIDDKDSAFENMTPYEVLSIGMPNMFHLPFIVHRKLMLHSAIYRTCTIGIYNFLSKKNPLKYPNEGYLSIIKEQFEYAVRHLKAYCKDNNIDLIFVLFPALTEDNAYPKLEASIDKARNILQSASIIYIDPKPYYKANATSLSELSIRKGDVCHFSALGHKLTAEVIYNFLDQEK